MINSFESSKTTSALIPSFNGNETALTQETETKTIGNIKDFDLPECLKIFLKNAICLMTNWRS